MRKMDLRDWIGFRRFFFFSFFFSYDLVNFLSLNSISCDSPHCPSRIFICKVKSNRRSPIVPIFASLSNFRFVNSFNFSKARPDSPSPSLVRLPLSVRASCRQPRHNHHSRNPIVCLLSHTPSSGLTLFPPRFHCVRSLSSLNNPRGNSRPKHSRRGAPCSQHVVC